MKINFSTAGDFNYAMNPQVEKRGDKRLMRMAQKGCTHFLLLTAPFSRNLDLHDPDLQKLLTNLGEDLLTANNYTFPEDEDITATCISFAAFRKENEYIELEDRTATYAICGCHYNKDNDVLNLLLPTPGMNFSIKVPIEIRYVMKPYMKDVRVFLFTKQERTPFYEVMLEKKTSFEAGSIVYTIGKMPYKFPVTEQMLGKKFLIRTDNEIPQFESTTAGVILRQEK